MCVRTVVFKKKAPLMQRDTVRVRGQITNSDAVTVTPMRFTDPGHNQLASGEQYVHPKAPQNKLGTTFSTRPTLLNFQIQLTHGLTSLGSGLESRRLNI